MKCPKSEEFFCFTPRSIRCEHDFDSKIHSADTVGVWRIILVLLWYSNYVMISSLHLLQMVSTHHFHSNVAAIQAFVWPDTPINGDAPRCPVPDQRLAGMFTRCEINTNRLAH